MSYVSQLSKESNNNNSSTVTFKTYNYMIIKYVSLSAKKLIYFNKHVLYSTVYCTVQCTVQCKPGKNKCTVHS